VGSMCLRAKFRTSLSHRVHGGSRAAGLPRYWVRGCVSKCCGGQSGMYGCPHRFMGSGREELGCPGYGAT
jgi:hypothetical protein